MSNLLEIKTLVTSFDTAEGPVNAVDGVSLSIPRGETVGLVGESGCGKSVLSLSVMDLVPRPGGKIRDGQILFDNKPLPLGDEEQMRFLRGGRMAMIFQEPMTSLNPVMKIGQQIIEAIRIHQPLDPETGQPKSRRRLRAEALERLKETGLPDPQSRLEDYPHNLSGGMRQRVMIAMAISCHPEFLIADEPTTALDVTVQAQIMELLAGLQSARRMSILLITHDLDLVAEHADKVYVMYAGQIVESGSAREVLTNPEHPYTRALLASRPRLGGGKYSATNQTGDKLPAIPGQVPPLREYADHCRFFPRCAHPKKQAEICARPPSPPRRSKHNGGQVACHFAPG